MVGYFDAEGFSLHLFFGHHKIFVGRLKALQLFGAKSIELSLTVSVFFEKGQVIDIARYLLWRYSFFSFLVDGRR